MASAKVGSPILRCSAAKEPTRPITGKLHRNDRRIWMIENKELFMALEKLHKYALD